jgi:predicted O-methyltransferase YrrM
MAQDTWDDVDRHLTDLLVRPDEALGHALAAAAEAGLPPISVSPAQGKMLHLLARAIGARRILEIGTLAGYSTIWLARALPPTGRLVTLESDPRHADVARANLARAGVADRVEVRVGRAQDTLPAMAAAGTTPFDLTFVDADRAGLSDYVRGALRLSRPGSLIVVDNVVRRGRLADPHSADPDIQAIRRMQQLVADEPRLSATVVQTVGTKGYDGFLLAVVGDQPG